MRIFLKIFFICSSFHLFSQQSNQIISNSFHGKVIGLGFNKGGYGVNLTLEKKILFDCGECSGIGNVYMLAFEYNVDQMNPNANLDDRTLLINDLPVIFNSESRVGSKKLIENQRSGYVHLKQISFNCLIEDSLKFNIPSQNSEHFVSGFYLVIECLISGSEKVDYEIVTNTENSNVNLISYENSAFNANPINLNKDVGFAVVGLAMNFLNGDESEVYVNNNLLGYIAGTDLSSQEFITSGVRGHFEYKSGVLSGLDDDTPDSLMYGTDALAEISSFLTSTNSFNYKIERVNPENHNDNYVIASVFSYTSTCEDFPYSVSSDTTICRNESIQLSATGGIRYEWQPYYDLSCSTCPNPIFTGDSSRFYTVRIWNNDSCSVVRPVKVNVTQLPEFSSITTTASTCEGTTGKIIASSNLTGESYAINGGTAQATGNFFNLAPGFYTVTLQALNGCSKDSIVEVGSVISTNAYFTANPAQGAPPLWVNFSNQSTNASNYEWFLNGVSQGNNYNSELFDTTGIYNIELIAWPNNPACADTFSLNIHVFDSLIVQIPNVFTPNNDGKNDIFGINTNLPVTVEYQLFNRWGNEMISGTKSNAISTSTNAYFTPLWDGKDATEGVYFYKMKIKAVSEDKIWEENMDGFLELLR